MRILLLIALSFFLHTLFPANALAQSPVVRVLQPSSGSVRKGAPILIRYELRHPPPSGSIGFFLEKHVPLTERYKYPGPSGPLLVRAQTLSPGQSTGQFTWDGNSFACAPSDAPMLCRTPAEPGTYVVEVVLFDQKDAMLAPLDWADSKPPQKVASAASAPFQIVGEPDLVPLARLFLGKTFQILTQQFLLERRAGLNLERYFTIGVMQAREGKYCQEFTAHDPFQGQIRVCGALGAEESELQAEGKFAMRPGILSFRDAKKAAEAVLIGPYRLRARHLADPSMEEVGFRGTRAEFQEWIRTNPAAKPYVERSMWRWVYRSDGGFWAFVFEVERAIKPGGPKDPFHGLVWVRVDNSAAACVVAQAPLEQDSARDILTDEMPCRTETISADPNK